MKPEKRGSGSTLVSSLRHLWPIRLLTMPCMQLSVDGWRGKQQQQQQPGPKRKWPLASCQQYRHYSTSRSGKKNLSRWRRRGRARGPAGRDTGLLSLYVWTRLNTPISLWFTYFLGSLGVSAVGRLASHRHLFSVGATAVFSTPWGTLPPPRRATS